MELQNGTYQARGIQAKLTETKAGNPQVAIEFELTQEGFEEKRITYYGSFSDKAFDITVKALRTCGWQGSDLNDLSGVHLNPVSLVIENEEFEGKTRPKVKWVNSAGGIAAKPLAAEKAKDFAAKMKAKILAFDQSNPAPAAANSDPATQKKTAEADIPF